VQKIRESRSNLNIHVREISADAIRRDRVIDDFLVVDRDLGWSEQRQIGQVPHDDLLEIIKIPEALEGVGLDGSGSPIREGVSWRFRVGLMRPTMPESPDDQQDGGDDQPDRRRWNLFPLGRIYWF
jgi:hypothetical protein